MTYMYTQVPI